MSRTLTPAVATAVAAMQSEYVHLVAFTFADPVTRAETTHYWSTGSAAVSWSGHTWVAVGGVLSVGRVRETSDTSAAELQVTLSAVDTSVVLTTLLANDYLGRGVSVYRAHLDATTRAIVADPLTLFVGILDGGFEISEDPPTNGVQPAPGTCTVIARCVSELARLAETRGIAANTASLGQYFPGDLFFAFVPALRAGNPIPWAP